jgi:hypothetical protein
MADDEKTGETTNEPIGGDAPAPEAVVPAGTTPAAAPPPPPGAPAVAPRRRRRWLPVFLVIIGVIVVIVIAGGALFVTRTLPPYQAANDFVDDLADNKFQAAASQLCDADSDDADTAITSVTRHFVGRDNVAVNPFGVDRDGDAATVDYTVSSDDTPDNDDDSKTFELRVVNEDGDWKPCPNAGAR